MSGARAPLQRSGAHACGQLAMHSWVQQQGAMKLGPHPNVWWDETSWKPALSSGPSWHAGQVLLFLLKPRVHICAAPPTPAGQVFNPPMAHSVVVPDTEDRALCRLMAVARGDGYISIYDIDHQPMLAQGSDCSGGSGGGAAGGGGKKAAKSKRKSGSSKSGGGSGTAAEAAVAAHADSARSSRAGTAATLVAEAAATEDPWRMPHVPGRVCLLGREHGGHTAAVNSLAFLAGSDWRRLLSGGNDGRLLLWDWQAAAARQGSAWRPPGEGQSQQQQQEQPDSAAAGAGGAADAVESEPSSSAAAAAEPAALPQVVLADLKHGRKINWVCSCEPVGGYGVFVADVTQRLTAVALR